MKLTWTNKFWQFNSSVLFSLLAASPVVAQINSDATLPHNSSVTAMPGEVIQIDGGTRAGNNVFHSFSDFSVPTGGTAFFNNATDIQNIFSRVTGSSITHIDGILRTTGNANLFLLNPNGIVFGNHAQLTIGGSFLATTASSINFADGTNFSANTFLTNSLLSVSVPVGLGFGSNPGAIRVQGTGNSINTNNTNFLFSPIIRGSTSTGLQVSPGKMLALIGGDIALEGGIMIADSGQIELGSVGEGVVSLSPNNYGWNFEYEGVSAFKDIQLSQRALADASGNGSGSIQVQGRNVSLRDGSVILIQNQGSQPANKISVNASESLELNGSSSDENVASSILTESLGSGNGGDITVFTKRLLALNGADILTRTFSSNTTAKGGDITINAIDLVKLSGFSPINYFTSNIAASTFSSANAGNVAVSTEQLTHEQGGNIGSGTFGTGNGGTVIVNASKFIELIGVEPINLAPSRIIAVTANAGNASKLIINTSRLTLRDGGRATSATLASGNAGSVTINATDSVEVTGTVPGSINPSLIDSSANISDKIIREILKLPEVPSGESGDVTINTGRLIVTNGGLVDVRNDGTGNAGKLIVNANSISLDNSGGITAATTSGSGGNITLNTQQLHLRHNSGITATAGSNGNGGNLNINANTIVALENSNITANANLGTGGNIQINTQGLFNSPSSLITASSNAGIQNQGIVNVKILGFDVNNSLTPITENLVSTEEAISGSCLASSNKQQGRFVVTGTGGVAPTPYEPLTGIYNLMEVKPLAANSSTVPTQVKPETAAWKIGDAIVEATAILRTPDGKVRLGSSPENATPESANSLVCHAEGDSPKL
jgi:filamentous hemagglutinin family protein